MHMDIFNMTMTVKYLFMHPLFRLWMRVSFKIDTHKHLTLIYKSFDLYTHVTKHLMYHAYVELPFHDTKIA